MKQLAFVFALITSLVCLPAQDTAVRLVYEFPIDAMQRAQQGNAAFDLEAIINGCVKGIRGRVGKQATVTRAAATTVHVVVNAMPAAELAMLRRKIEVVGALEMQIVATHDYEVDGERLDLAVERRRLQAWLNDGGRDKLAKDPLAIESYQPESPDKIRWVTHLVRADRRDPTAWSYPFHKMGSVGTATVRAFDDKQWNDGKIPQGLNTRKDNYLIELVALDRRTARFTEQDLDRTKISISRGFNNQPAINYAIVAERSKDYGDFSQRHIGRCSAIVVVGILVSAPQFISRIPGRGIIGGNFTKQQAEDLALALRSGRLAAAPKLVRQEAVGK